MLSITLLILDYRGKLLTCILLCSHLGRENSNSMAWYCSFVKFAWQYLTFSISGLMCTLLLGTVTMEKLIQRFFRIVYIFFFSLSMNTIYSLWTVRRSLLCNDKTLHGYWFQDCAGVILCAAERATQVALQVKMLVAWLHRLAAILLWLILSSS